MQPSVQDYLSPGFNLGSIDKYYARTSILDAIRQHRKYLTGILLDVGCGKMPYKEILLHPEGQTEKYVGLDLDIPVADTYSVVKPDLLWDGQTIPLEEECMDSVMLTEVLEHCFDPATLLKETYRVLRKGGHLFITVPFLWPLHDMPYDEYRYTPSSLERHLVNAGYKNIEVKALGGWNASLGQMLALWLNRSGLSSKKRRLIYSSFLKRTIAWLYKHDRKPQDFVNEPSMITGLTALAEK
jgi:ubiquinone/menaquinone biosynthesis C-methylase UbiE